TLAPELVPSAATAVSAGAVPRQSLVCRCGYAASSEVVRRKGGGNARHSPPQRRTGMTLAQHFCDASWRRRATGLTRTGMVPGIVLHPAPLVFGWDAASPPVPRCTTSHLAIG